MPKCPDCGVQVNNLRKHKARNRCEYQHIRKSLEKRRKQIMREKLAKEKVFYKNTAEQPDEEPTM